MELNKKIPSDVIFEIMSHMPLRAMTRCRVVSKECYSNTYESWFLNLHRKRTRAVSGYFIQSMNKNGYSSSFVSIDIAGLDTMKNLQDFLPGQVKIEASASQGILLCVDTKRNHGIPKYYVCKPTTEEWRAIPNPRTRYVSVSHVLLALGLKPLRFKIIRLSRHKYTACIDKDCYRLRCEIFDSEIWRWRQLEDVRLHSNDMLKGASSPVIYVHGMVHWLTVKNIILSYNVDEATWTTFQLPEWTRYSSESKLVEHQGRLAFISQVGEDYMELWAMDNHENREWSRIERISKESKPLSHLASLYSADVLLMKEINNVIFYKFKNGSFDVVKVKSHKYVEEVFPIYSDLEPCDMMRGSHRQHQ